ALQVKRTRQVPRHGRRRRLRPVTPLPLSGSGRSLTLEQAFDLVEDRAGDLAFGRLRYEALPAAGHERDLVLLGVEADIRAGDLVEDDQVPGPCLEQRGAQ